MKSTEVIRMLPFIKLILKIIWFRQKLTVWNAAYKRNLFLYYVFCRKKLGEGNNTFKVITRQTIDSKKGSPACKKPDFKKLITCHNKQRFRFETFVERT